MMFRFSCFNSHILSHKQRKTVQLSSEAMQKNLEDCSQNQALNNLTYSKAAISSDLNVDGDDVKISADCATDSSPVEYDCKSEEIESKYSVDCDISIHKTANIKKSRSLGSRLYIKGGDVENASEDEIDQQFSCDASNDNCGSLFPNGAKDSRTSLPEFQEVLPPDAFQVNSDVVNHGSTCSIGDAQHCEKVGHENCDTQFSGEGESGDCTPRTPLVIIKSSSLPNIGSPSHCPVQSLPHSRSAEDLSVLDSRRKETLTHEVRTQVLQRQESNDAVWNGDARNDSRNPVDDSYVTYNYVGAAKDWIIPAGDDINANYNIPGDSSVCKWDKLPSEDFRIKRIEDWVVDLQHFGPLEVLNEPSPSEGHDIQKYGSSPVVSAAKKTEDKVNPGMDAVKKYISSLTPAATSAQLVNHGLVVIPFLSAFSGLRALNLSGNAIVRITAGALPRGLHILNLSKNNISAIEGLRELTRLRVLDLSYNRILRIGHGLASCSSLKELYLAGNKISEVEGLHRLLKLNVLDLRFNKISTTKCLGQLAANYLSLQAISLEGNPAQKNVGDEQLKKYLQGLLPHLTYFNRQPIKVGTLKDSADRSARLGISAHQIDRGIKSELKAMRKGTHGLVSHKGASSSIHGRRGQPTTSSKPSRSRHVRPPTSGTKPAILQSHLHEFSSKLESFRSALSMRRSRSEGTLGAL